MRNKKTKTGTILALLMGITLPAFAGGVDLSHAQHLQDYPQMRAGDSNRVNFCEATEIVGALNSYNNPVFDLSKVIDVQFVCIANIDGFSVITKVKRVFNISATGFRQAGPFALGQSSEFIFAARDR